MGTGGQWMPGRRESGNTRLILPAWLTQQLPPFPPREESAHHAAVTPLNQINRCQD